MDNEKVVQPKTNELAIEHKVEEVVGPESPITIEPEVHQEQERAKLPPNFDWNGHPIFFEVSQYLNLDKSEESGQSRKVSALINWAIKTTGSTETGDILSALKYIERRIPKSNERKYAILYRYVALLGQKEDIGKQIKALEY